MVKLETIAINILGRSLSVTGSSGVEKVAFEKKHFGPKVMQFVEEYITKHGFEVTNVETSGNVRLYHLIKK